MRAKATYGLGLAGTSKALVKNFAHFACLAYSPNKAKRGQKLTEGGRAGDTGREKQQFAHDREDKFSTAK